MTAVMRRYGFCGRVAFVTGAAQGIGRGIAQRLAEEGASLVLLDKNRERLAEAAEQVQETGVEVKTVCTDVCDRLGIQSALETAVHHFNNIDFLVNVAGVGEPSQFFDVREEDWDRTVEVNLKGTFLTCQLIGAHMAERKQGRIVNIASIAGKTGSETLAPYSASKGGVILLTQSISRALAAYGIGVNAVCPGLVWTPMWRNTATWIGKNDLNFKDTNMSPEDIFEAVVRGMTPLGVPTTAEDIAATAAFLLSDDARMITGQSINVDGGIEVH